MNNRYLVNLSEEERERLQNVLLGNFLPRIKNRAEILLRIDAGDTYRYISQIMKVSQNTITNTLNRYLYGGIDWLIVPRNNIDKYK